MSQAKTEETKKKREKPVELFSPIWDFDIPSKVHMQAMGQEVLKQSFHVRRLPSYPWDDFYVRPTIMMVARDIAKAPQVNWIHSMELLDVYTALELLAINIIRSSMERWASIMQADGIKTGSLHPEITALEDVDKYFVAAHETMINLQQEAVREFRAIRELSVMFSAKAASSILVAVAAKTLTQWVQEAEMFYHKMSTVAIALEAYLKFRVSKNTKSHAAAFERLQKSLGSEYYSKEHVKLPAPRSASFNQFVHRNLLTTGIVIAPEELLNDQMKSNILKIKENIPKLLALLEPRKEEQAEKPVEAPTELGPIPEEEKEEEPREGCNLTSYSESEEDGDDDDDESEKNTAVEVVESEEDEESFDEDRVNFPEESNEYVTVSNSETIVDELKRKFGHLNTEV
jgi:hypothetical protein